MSKKLFNIKRNEKVRSGDLDVDQNVKSKRNVITKVKVKIMSDLKKKENRKEESDHTVEKILINSKKKGLGIRGIKFKIIGSFMIPVALIVILGVLSYTKASNAIIDNYRSAMNSTVMQSGKYFNVVIQNIERQTSQLAGDASLINYYSGTYKGDPVDEQNQYLLIKKSVFANSSSQKDINNIAVISSYGKDVFFAEKIKSGTFDKLMASEEGEKIKEAKTKGLWSGYHLVLDETLKSTTEEYALSYTRSVMNTSLKQIAIVIMDIKMTTVKDALNSIELPEGSISSFVTNDGREIMVGSDKESLFVDSTFFKNAIASEETTGSEDVVINDEKYMYIYSKIGETGCVVNVLLPEDQITKQAQSIRTLTIAIVVVATFIAAFVGFMIATGFGNAIKKINKIVQKAADGDLTVLAKTKRKDEFLLLSKHISGMLSGMKKLIQGAADVSNAVADSADSVASSSEQLVEASKSILEVIEQIEAGITQQADDAVICISKMTYLEEKINNVNIGTQKISKFSQDTKEIVKNGIISIEELDSKAKATTKITHTVIESIEELERESNSIGSITGAMNEIAEQTSLLSLNASIEAARAGNAGRGFAVVADEIRKLADASLESSKKINKIIESIQTKTKETVKNAKEAEEIVTSQETALKKTVHVFDDITEHVEGLNEYITAISSGVEDIEEAKNETMTAIESISAMLEETAASSAEVQAAAEGQLTAAEKLNQAAAKLGEESGQLQETISSFII
ncbi:MAG TPA: methyl-accepting chemotaxis protein [Lachnospiraceae bacterium]|nr:methyl-accepting chemotaxis protein [Lachnospiraceae bacterium]